MSKFSDNRGSLFFPIKNNEFVSKECTVSINSINVFRGIHISNFEKLVTCIKGKIFDIIIDMDPNSPSYLNVNYFILDPKSELFQILIPKNYGHAFFSLEEGSTLIYHFSDFYSDDNTTHIHYLDPYISLRLPINNELLILSEKDNVKNFVKPIDYVIFGAKGYIGSTIVKYLKELDKNYIICNLRLEDLEIKKYLEFYSPKYVINCAGLTGTPNISWCDDHKIETLNVNVTYQLLLANICNELGIHITLLGSAAIFKDDKYYSEEDVGNFDANFYSQARILLEKQINVYDNFLYLRINCPFSREKNGKNLLTKLLNYKNIDNVDISVTYLDNLIPVLFNMIESNEKGICNFTNDGSINLCSIVNIWNSINIEKKHDYISKKCADSKSMAKLTLNKLNKWKVMNSIEAVEDCCKNY